MTDLKPAIRSILWAIDPLAKDKSLQAAIPNLITALTRNQIESIYPVSVILEEQIPYLAGPHITAADFKAQIEEHLSDWVKQFKLPNLRPVELIFEPTFSIKAAASRLVNVAQDMKCDLIACTTHAKPRKDEKELGTFSESLFLLGKGSIFFVHPRTSIPPVFREILFPTDLSEASLQALNEIAPAIKFLNAHLTLFHKTVNLDRNIIDLPFGGDAKSKYVTQKQMDKTFALQQVVNELTKTGVLADLVIDSMDSEYVSQIIAVKAKSLKDGFIALSSHSQHFPSSVPGSITRQLLRTSELPIWVLYPPLTKESNHGFKTVKKG